jgi:hypothetical protein
VGRSLRKELHDALAEHSIAAQQGREGLDKPVDLARVLARIVLPFDDPLAIGACGVA